MIKLRNNTDAYWFLFGLFELLVGLSYLNGKGGFLIGAGLFTLAMIFVQPPN